MNKLISKIDNMNRSLDNMNNHNVPITTKLNKKKTKIVSGILVLSTEMNPSSNYEVKLSLTTYTTPKYNRSSIHMHFSIYTCNNLRSLFNNYKNIKRPPPKKTKISVTLRNVYRTLPQSSFIIVSQTFSKFADIHLISLCSMNSTKHLSVGSKETVDRKTSGQTPTATHNAPH